MTDSVNRLQPISALNLKNQIHAQVRDVILNGVLKPGEHLVETTVADQLKVSRAPVREVLSALEQEGLVVNVPRRGAFVVDFTDADIEEIYSLRLLLEIGALCRAIGTLTPRDLTEMQQAVDDIKELTRRADDPDAVVRRDLSFHEMICRAANHRRLFSAWNSMRWQTQLLIGLTSKTYHDQPSQPHHIHQSILDAVVARDLAEAEAMLTSHMQDAENRARNALHALRSGRTGHPLD